MIVPTSNPELYSPRQISVAAFVGSPAAAGWFFWRNERALGRPATGARWFWWLVATTAALITVAFFLPEKFPHFIIPFAYTVGLRGAAKSLYELPLAQSGVQAAWGLVIGVSVLCLVIVLALIFGVVFLLPEQPA